MWWPVVLDQAQCWELAVGKGHPLYKMAVVQGRKGVLVWPVSSERGQEHGCQKRSRDVGHRCCPPLLDPASHSPFTVPDSHLGLWRLSPYR